MNTKFNITERLEALIIRRELSKAKRLALMRKRLAVNLDGYKSHYEDI